MNPQKKIVDMKRMMRAFHYFLPGSSPYHKNDNMSLSFSFDFETHPENKRNLNLYLEIFYPKHADMLYGSNFEYTLEDGYLTDESLLTLMTEKTLPDCYEAYNKLCAEANITLPEFKEDKDLVKTIVQSIQQNIPLRLKEQSDNKDVLSQILMHFSPGNRTNLFHQATIVVIDQLLMLSPYCDRLHNRRMLLQYGDIPFPKYLTLRLKCRRAIQEKTSFNLFEAIMLIQASDCALQVLLGPVYDTIVTELNKNGLTSEKIKDYIKFSTEMRQNLKETLIKSGATITNLEKNIDWPSLLK